MSLLLTGIVSTQYGSTGCHGDKDYYAIDMVGLLRQFLFLFLFFFTNLVSVKVIQRSAGKELLTQAVGPKNSLKMPR